MPVPENFSAAEFAQIYARFQSPITRLDCGRRCSPYNENGVPFCCDTDHAVPTAYQAEWVYLQENTDLWQPWQPNVEQDAKELRESTPDGQVLIACRGHQHCQRGFRSITCRAFPFFPYLTSQGEFIGLSYYWEYEDRCWVISNLNQMQPEYLAEFVAAYELIFKKLPGEKENFVWYSAHTRESYARKGRSVPLLHRNGGVYKVAAASERMRRTTLDRLPKFGPYKVAARLPFPDEGQDQ
jgi:hypothetical protein